MVQLTSSSSVKNEMYHVIQPIYNIVENKIHGFEVLLRSTEEKNPQVLFQQARESNRLYELDMGSIKQALQTISTYMEAEEMNEIYLFFNVFPSTLMNPKFYLNLHNVITSYQLSTDILVLEINEAEHGTDMSELIKTVNHLRQDGFIIALDDVGSGESSIRTLLELKPSIAKIDRFFAMNLSQDDKKQKLLHALASSFKNEMTLVLEGIELEEDLHAARGLGIDFIQGFLLGKPKPIHYYFIK